MSSAGNRLGGILEEVIFIPTPQMRKCKAAYLAATADNPVSDRISLEGALQATGENRLRQWWSTPGFRSWFENRDEFRQRVEYLANLALDAIEEILLDGDANATARNAAAKLMIEAAGKLPGRGAGQDRFADEHINQMNKQQLEQYLRKNGVLPGGSRSVEASEDNSEQAD